MQGHAERLNAKENGMKVTTGSRERNGDAIFEGETMPPILE